VEEEKAALEREYDQRLVELQSLFELSKTLSSSLKLKTILDTLLFTPMGRMLITQGAVLLAEKNNTFKCATLKGLPRELSGLSLSFAQVPELPTEIDSIDDILLKGFLEKFGLKLVSPICSNHKCIGLILLGKKLGNVSYTPDDLEYLASMANLAAPAIENSNYLYELQHLNRRLDKKIQELNTLFDIGKELNATLEKEKISNTLAYAILGEMMVKRCIILLAGEDELFAHQTIKGFKTKKGCRKVLADEHVRGIQQIGRPLLVQDIQHSDLMIELEEHGIEVIVPMISQDNIRGSILVGHRMSNVPLQETEIEFLATLGNAAVISLENARLFKETLARQKLEEELALARDIQQRLLPDKPPVVNGLDFAGLNRPSLQVGGDYYDFIRIDGERIALAIGDVSGKGVGASLLMANVQASLHALIHARCPLAETVARINSIIHKNTSVDKFITFFLAIVDLEKRTFTYVNAGHNPPFLIDGENKIKLLETGGLILGMLPDSHYDEAEFSLDDNTSILMYTDGVNEALNDNDEEFETWRIENYFVGAKEKTAWDLISGLENDVRTFMGSAPQADDITIIAMHTKPKI